jgi:hypothetical protein
MLGGGMSGGVRVMPPPVLLDFLVRPAFPGWGFWVLGLLSKPAIAGALTWGNCTLASLLVRHGFPMSLVVISLKCLYGEVTHIGEDLPI